MNSFVTATKFHFVPFSGNFENGMKWNADFRRKPLNFAVKKKIGSHVAKVENIS